MIHWMHQKHDARFIYEQYKQDTNYTMDTHYTGYRTVLTLYRIQNSINTTQDKCKLSY